MLIVFICHRCVDQIKRKSAHPCKEGVGVGGSEKHGDNGTSITVLCCYSMLLCVGAQQFWGCMQAKDQMGAESMPHSLSISLQLQFQL